MTSRLARILLPVAFAGAAVFAVAAPASAATPSCNGTGTFYRPGVYATYPAYNGNGGCIIREGNSGEDVKALQRGLKRCYVSGLVVDGAFGAKTLAALKTAQSRAGVTADGVYGPTTAGAINFPYYSNTTDAYAGCYNRR